MADDDNDLFDDNDLDEDEDEQDEDEDKEDEDKDDDNEDELEEEDLYYEKDRYATDMTVKIVAKHKRRTSNRISLFEFVNAVGTRAEQIASGDELYIPIGTHESAMEIAEAEIRAGRCPFIIERKLCSQGYVTHVEHWSLRELILPVA
jgi:DNA-directed RNA polymerase subunit K/omega